MGDEQKTGDMGVVRFDPWGKMERDTEGAFVSHTDYAVLEARFAELENNHSSAVMGEIEATERASKAEAELTTLRDRMEREPVVKAINYLKDAISVGLPKEEIMRRMEQLSALASAPERVEPVAHARVIEGEC